MRIIGYDPEAPRDHFPLPKGKLNILWRQGRAGYVATVGGKDLHSVSPEYSKDRAVEQVREYYGDEAAEKFQHIASNGK